MKRLARLLLAAAAVATLLTCSDKKPPAGGCKQETDCADGFTCVDGDCVEKAAGVAVCGLCNVSSDCDPQYVCAQIEATRKACAPACDAASPDCPTGFHCAEGASATSAACIPNTAVCCVDQDNDGFGAGVDCTNADCSDTNPHCTTDCTDADGDTWCVGHDCDDALPNCDADCTDLDSDDWCVGHDCKDDDELLTDVCPVCEVDVDGDGYGVGCAAGADCDDANPNCNADCTDVDGDGWCLGRDCDDTLPKCDADCTDPDGDGYCGIKDCDPANGHCFSTCVDADSDNWCAETDCDDTKAHCDATCTDVDADGWCVGHDCDDTKEHCAANCTNSDTDVWCDDQDCDDTDPLRNADCSGCSVDQDGDGYGVGCVLGADCDDFKPHCALNCTDVDADGWCIDQECNDAAAGVNPAAAEVCNGIDDNCTNGVDTQELPNAVLCPNGANVYTTECYQGNCRIASTGCAPDYYDINGTFTDGCECKATPSTALGASCTSAIQVTGPVSGEFADVSGSTAVTVTGTIPDFSRVVWYRFRATDTGTDNPTDNFYVHVWFDVNPGTQFIFDVYKGTCTSTKLTDNTNTNDDFLWQIGTTGACDPIGCDACPPAYCGNAEPNPSSCNTDPKCNNLSNTTCRSLTPKCENNSDDFYVGVRRRVAVSSSNGCNTYSMKIKNGRI